MRNSFHFLHLLLPVFLLLTACHKEKEERAAGAFSPTEAERDSIYDLYDIRQSGELIAVTLSGPDTYYEVQEQPMGRQYALAADFARGEGVRLRMVMAHDTTEMVNMLRTGRADMIALPLSRDFARRMHLALPGEGKKAPTSTKKTSPRMTQTLWAVRPEARELLAAIERWRLTPAPTVAAKREETEAKQLNEVKRTVHAPWISRERGIISEYDDLFRRAAEVTGWDWRLIAAQCYQESGFDPTAQSGAGARGLMQIMPGTASEIGLTTERITVPEDNIMGGAEYIHRLTGKFDDILAPSERIKFVLAAYNCGTGHVRDAMALARKYGRNEHLWNDIEEYILLLQDARYYRDPVVNFGYMDGQQTADYVTSVLERFREYGGEVTAEPRTAPTHRSVRIRPMPAPGRNDI